MSYVLWFFCCVGLHVLLCYFFFFKQKTAYEMRISDWSSDVCSSDLARRAHPLAREALDHRRAGVAFEQFGGHFRFEIAGLDDIDADSAPRPFACQRLPQMAHRRLGRAIDRGRGKDLFGGDRSDQDDAAVLLFAADRKSVV